jgi:hypothetical protein
MRWTKSVAKNRIDMPWSVVSCKLTLLETQVASAPSQALVENMKGNCVFSSGGINADDVDADRDPEIAGGGAADE